MRRPLNSAIGAVYSYPSAQPQLHLARRLNERIPFRAMLQIEQITYRIGNRVLLESASINIPDGHRVGLIGRNGTGKTTLLRTIAGLQASQGLIQIDGHSLGAYSRREVAKQIAIVPVSAHTGQGIPELLMVLTGLAQKYFEEKLEIDEEGYCKGTILEVKEEKGLGV